MADIHLEKLKAQRTELAGRILEIEAEQAEHYRLWAVEEINTPAYVRAPLAAELARLRVERHRISQEFEAAKQAYLEGRRTEHLAALVQLLKSMDLGHLVEQARTNADQAAAA